ncbi:protein ALP1-like [Cornus florida]|uniref:protein ALP1-like n=1 Tax=Cornus florida TaxID=4283 RepID=UPI00289A0970|nr:protein ALP1-like [Cornus florida]
MERRNNMATNEWFLWEQRRRLAATQVICLVVYWLLRKKFQRRNYVNRLTGQSTFEREMVRNELMNQLRTNQRCRDITRMGPEAFQNLCEILKRDAGLKATKNASVEEQVAKFLHILSHNVRNRTIQFFFRRSGETTSHHFHSVLRSIISLEEKFLRQPNGLQIPPKILSNSRFYPYFKNCVGAIDGTHVRVRVPTEDAPRYRGRKNFPTTNVLAACSFDLRFTYVLPGWEGTASDSRVIKSAFERKDKLRIPKGKYYLVDGGYMLRGGLITPYRGVRYHLKEFASHRPENPRELFNLRHASLRNAIERAFGVLKKRFPIIGSTTEPTYSIETQTEIILACCILHNYLMGVDPDERHIDEVDRELLNQVEVQVEDEDEDVDDDRTPRDIVEGEHIRDIIAMNMWNDYVANQM